MRRSDFGYPMTDRQWREVKNRLELCMEMEFEDISKLLKDGTLVDEDWLWKHRVRFMRVAHTLFSYSSFHTLDATPCLIPLFDILVACRHGWLVGACQDGEEDEEEEQKEQDTETEPSDNDDDEDAVG